jgi:hypothetical protein
MTHVWAVQEYTLQPCYQSIDSLLREANTLLSVGSLLSRELKLLPDFKTKKQLPLKKLALVASEYGEATRPSHVLRDGERFGFGTCSLTDMLRLVCLGDLNRFERYIFVHPTFNVPRKMNRGKRHQYVTMLDDSGKLRCVKTHSQLYVSTRDGGHCTTRCILSAP